MKFSIISFSKNGALLGANICNYLIEKGYGCLTYAQQKYADTSDLILDQRIADWAKEHFCDDCLIFIGAAGIAARAIAPHIRSKATDPAVLVIDDRAQFVIPLLSGHIGGANKIALMLSEYLVAVPVITSASDINGKFSVDAWAAQHDIAIVGIGEIKHITSALLDGKTVGLVSDYPIEGELPEGICFKSDGEWGICISLDEHKKPFSHTINLVPRIISLGIGCRKGCAYEKIETAALETIKQNKISMWAIKNTASIDLKKNEAGLIEFAERYDLRLITFSAEELASVKGVFSSSDFVAGITGVDNVCERAAVVASGNGKLLSVKQAYDGVTTALAAADWRVRF